jgi:hypothetical protein
LALKINASAQVVLTQKDSIKIGTEVINATITDTTSLNNFEFKKSGIDNFWDFSTLPLNYNDTIKFKNIDNTPYSVNFSDADFAFNDSKKSSNSIQYFKSDSIGFYMLGLAGNLWPCPIYQPLRYKKQVLIMPYQITYPYSWLDTFKSRTDNYLKFASGDTMFCEQNICARNEIIATGRIKLAFGVFESFLVRHDYSFFDTTWTKKPNGSWESEINVVPSKAVFYDWYCNKSTFQVARIRSQIIDKIDYINVQMNNYANLKSLTVEDVSNLKTKIYPNPATEKLYIENNLAKNSNYSITNLLGQEIDKGLLKSEIDISHLLNGVYVLKIVDTNNQNEIFKFVKQ